MKRFYDLLNSIYTRSLIFVILLIHPLLGQAEGFGELAGGLSDGIMHAVRPFINAFSYIVGFMFLVVGIRKYQALKAAPHEITFETPLTYFIMGIILILLPLVYYLAKKMPGSSLLS